MYVFLYLLNVVIFSFVYLLIFRDDFNNISINLVQSIYFSVVTVTTLGYGDLTPKLDSAQLLLTITAQVIIGVVTIGLFLNAISHKLSERKDFIRRESERELEKRTLAKLLAILKSVVTNYLGILAETYKVTTTLENGFIEAIPSELFNQDYYDQISRQDFLSVETRYGTGVMKWGEFIDQENSNFSAGLDDFLDKFTVLLPIELVELLVDLKSHHFLYHCRSALQHNKFYKKAGLVVPQINLLTIEHSSINLPEKPNTIRDFHEKLLRIILTIEDNTEGGQITMTIDLRKGVTAPPIGSAIGDIIKFGPFE